MNVVEKLVAAGLTNRDFTLSEGAKALGVDEARAAFILVDETLHNDDFDLFFRVNDSTYDSFNDIPKELNAKNVQVLFYLYVETEDMTKVRRIGDRIIRYVIATTIVICGLVLAAGWVLGVLK